MRRAVLAGVCIALAPAMASAQMPVERRAALGADAAVRIQNMTGSVRVLGWDHDSIAVSGTITETKTAQFLFHASGAGAKLGVWDEAGETPDASDLEVRVPKGAVVWVKTGSAAVTVSGVTGSLDVYSVSGSIAISGTPREVRAESLSGEVRIEADTRMAQAKTATADITLRGAIDDATASTVSGALTLDLRTRSGRFESVDGDILWDGGAVDGRTTLDFVTHAGAVELRMPADAVADFVVGTYEGGFDDRLGVTARRTGSSLKGTELRFQLGARDAGGQVTVRSFKGRVLLTRG